MNQISRTRKMLQTAGWAGLGQLSKTVTSFINMLLVARLGVTEVLIVASAFMVTLIYMAIDSSFRGGTSLWISQSTSEKKKNLPKSLLILINHRKETEKQTVLVQTITLQTLWFSMAFGLLVGGLAIVFPSEILQLFGASDAIAQEGTAYFQVTIGSIFLLSLSGTWEGTLQNIDHTKCATQAGIIKHGTHLLLALGGIYFLHIGVVGIAWAAILGQAAGILYMTYFLRKWVFPKKLIPFCPNWSFQKDAMRSAAPLVADMLFYQLNYIVWLNILQTYSDVFFASQRIALEIVAFPSAIFWGFYVAVGRFVSQAYGDNDFQLVKQHTTKIVKIGFLTSSVLLSIVFLIGKQLAKLFTDDPKMITTVHQWILIYVFSNAAAVLYNIIAKALKAVRKNTIIVISSFSSNVFWFISQLVAWKYMNHWAVAASNVLYLSLEVAIIGGYFYRQKWVSPAKKAA